ncbi:Palmitoyltransferase ZDHHC16 [Pseudolycoriella hygida]|uniref:Palmitoyltransferase n=1 Tax=Pseudolycoriella hygida TaxID=35572 RepID=A0A9Q0MYL3_9DIPT|nr:Palmitoyltransferase ZDHHC16 [Pseudolycoriella hygida]
MHRNMGRITWRLKDIPKNVCNRIQNRYHYAKQCIMSLMYNHHMNQSYASDVCMEPIFWFVDNFTHLLGPFFVVGVAVLTATVVYIAHWIGLPFWYNKSPLMAFALVVVGYWLLFNVIFHYYMAVTTPPGVPPDGVLIVEAVSICKKCIAPKPPRTHHCSVCNKCILKMDHHCPWLNNCVGYGNHRYFILYMVYTTIGTLFIILFGAEIGYNALWMGDGEGWLETEPLEGHPIRFNLSGHIIPVTEMNEYGDEGIIQAIHDDLPIPHELTNNAAKHRAIIFMAFICVSVTIALGSLTIWHVKLIKRGETSIEAHINISETKRLAALGKIYTNPYDFGPRKNILLFLGLVRKRTWWRHVLLPSPHKPEGNGLTWYTVNDVSFLQNEWP